MATSNTQIEAPPPRETVYDGFISYSHAADDLLAPRLQAGLQRFAKPWWKRRAIRIFRDESSLAANPHLWSSITDALDGSAWFVLLLSPDAAQSDWVNREIDFWLEHKDANRIIPVLTDGAFTWRDGDIGGDAAPPALRTVFADEPRWVDLRFARTEEQLDLSNASFRAAVADVASPIRGVPKDELESEEVRQHRRTRRTAIGAGVALVALTVAAMGAALLAIDRSNEATAQRLAAEESAAEADAERVVAEQQTEVAEQQTELAQQLEFEARSDAIAAAAIAQLDIDPELALLLATEALRREVQLSSLTATHQALQQHRVLFRLGVVPGDRLLTSGAVGGLSPDGFQLVVAGQGSHLELWNVGGDAPVWTVEFPAENTTVLDARFSDDGGSVVVLETSGSDGPLDSSELHVLDAATGRLLSVVPIPGVRRALYPSAMAPYVDLTEPLPWVLAEQFGLNAGFFDAQTGSFTPVTELNIGITGLRFGVPTTDAGRRFFAVGSEGPGRVIDLPTGKTVLSFEGGISTLSPDGTRLLIRGHEGRPLEFWDIGSVEVLWDIDLTFTRASFSADGSLIYAASPDTTTYVFDAESGEQILALGAQEGVPQVAIMSLDAARLATFATDFTATVWDLGPLRSEGLVYVTNTEPRRHLPDSADLSGGIAAVWGGAADQEAALWETTIVDLSNGARMATVSGGVPALSPDGKWLAYRTAEEVQVLSGDLKGRGEPGTYVRVGPVRIIDIDTGSEILELAVPCVAFLTPAGAVPSAGCLVEPGEFQWDLEFSMDGRMLGMANSHELAATVWDTTTGQVILKDELIGARPRTLAFSPDGRQLAVLSSEARGHLYAGPEHVVLVFNIDPVGFDGFVAIDEAATLTELVFTPDGSRLLGASSDGDVEIIDAHEWERVEPIPAHQGSVLDVAVNESGTLVASAGADAFVRVWNLADRSLVTEVGFAVDEIVNVEFIDDAHLFVTAGFGNEAVVITLDPDELLEVARARLFRGFSATECATFGIDPCPTLDELKGG